jgi:hypothetical protein
MRRSWVAWILCLLLCAPADAVSPARPLQDGAILSLDVHRAAWFLARAFWIQVVVVGGGPEPIHLSLKGLDAEHVLQALAAAAHLTLTRWGTIWVLTPDSVARALASPTDRDPSKDLLNLEGLRMEGDQLIDDLAHVLHLTRDGHLGGRATIVGKHFSVWQLLDLASRLSGKEATRRGRFLVVGGAWPEIDRQSPPACPAPPRATRVELYCAEGSSLEMAAWAQDADGLFAAARARTKEGDSVAFVEKGTELGHPRASVRTIAADGITLSDQRKLRPSSITP